MPLTKVFTSFDYDHDEDLRVMFVGQSKHSDTPFELADWSLQDALPGDWITKVRTRIKRVDQVVVICGQFTNQATGVAAELTIAQEEGKPYFLLKGRKNLNCTPPTSARWNDKIYDWTWNNLKALIGGAR